MPNQKQSLTDLERAFSADRSNDGVLLQYLTALTRNMSGDPGLALRKAVMKVLNSYPVGHQTNLIELITQLMQSPDELLSEDDKKELADSETSYHREVVASAIDKWLSGETILEYEASSQLKESHRDEIKRLSGLMTIQSYSYKEETNSDIKSSYCKFKIGKWSCEVEYETSYYLERDEIRFYGPKKLALYADYDSSCKPENWLVAAKSIGTSLPPSLLLCYIYQVGFNHVFHIAPYDYHFEDLIERLDKLQPALDNSEEHSSAMAKAVEEWLDGESTMVWAKTCPTLTAKDKKEVRRLLKNTAIKSFVFENPAAKLVNSVCEFSIGKWEAKASWKSRFAPRVRDCQIFHIEHAKITAFESGDQTGDWEKAAKAAKSKLSLEQFIYFVHIVAFDLIHNDVKSYRPQWTTDFKKTLKGLKNN